MAISKDKLIGKEGVSLEVDSVTSYLSSASGDITTTSAGGKIAIDVAIADASGISLDVALSAASDSVAAWLADGAGNPISSTSGSLHVRLNEVNIVDSGLQVYLSGVNGPLEVEATAFDIRALSSVTDSISSWLSDGSGNAISSTAGALNVNISTTSDVLDIRDLVFASDKVDVSGSSVTVSATALDIRSLSSSSDSVVAVQGISPYNVNQSAVFSTNPYKLSALNSEQVNVTTTAALLTTQTLVPEQMLIQNLGNKAIYVGKSGVTTATGIRVAAGATFVFETGGENPLAVTDSGTCDVRVIPYLHRASAAMPI